MALAPQWKPGQSGNPKGRPKKGQSLTEALSIRLDAPVLFDGQTMPGREAVARKLVALALDGDVAAIRYIYDRVDGLPTARIEALDPLPECTFNIVDPEAKR